jgi:transcriptional regulator with XRE-family HTH domain
MGFSVENFAKYLKELRENTMYKQSEVAEAIDITVQTYGKYENGLREPNIDILYRLASFFKISPILFLINDYPLEEKDYINNKFSILSIMAANYEKYKWLCKRYDEKNVYSSEGVFGNLKYIKKHEKNLMQVKSSLFRMHSNLLTLKTELLKEIDRIEEQTKFLIKKLDDTI